MGRYRETGLSVVGPGLMVGRNNICMAMGDTKIHLIQPDRDTDHLFHTQPDRFIIPPAIHDTFAEVPQNRADG